MLIVWFLSIKSLPNLLFGVLCLPGDQSHPVCATDNKPSCVLHLLGWFIGSRGFFSLERRPEFWVLQTAINSQKKRYNQSVNMKRYSTSLILREIQIKAIIQYFYLLMQQFEKTDSSNFCTGVGKKKHFCPVSLENKLAIYIKLLEGHI